MLYRPGTLNQGGSTTVKWRVVSEEKSRGAKRSPEEFRLVRKSKG